MYSISFNYLQIVIFMASFVRRAEMLTKNSLVCLPDKALEKINNVRERRNTWLTWQTKINFNQSKHRDKSVHQTNQRNLWVPSQKLKYSLNLKSKKLIENILLFKDKFSQYCENFVCFYWKVFELFWFKQAVSNRHPPRLVSKSKKPIQNRVISFWSNYYKNIMDQNHR